MEHFVDEYFSVERFKKTYARRVEQLGDRSFWPEVEIAADMVAPIAKRGVERQRKNRFRGCLEGGSGKKASEDETEKAKKVVRGRFKCPNCGELGHRKNSPKCPHNGTKKIQVLHITPLCHFVSLVTVLIASFVCRKRKPRKNITKGWFLKKHLL
jgi:rubrerythrin